MQTHRISFSLYSKKIFQEPPTPANLAPSCERKDSSNLQVATTTTLAPFSEKWVDVDPPTAPNKSHLLVMPLADDDAMATPGLYMANKATKQISVINTSELPITLLKGQTIAHVELSKIESTNLTNLLQNEDNMQLTVNAIESVSKAKSNGEKYSKHNNAYKDVNLSALPSKYKAQFQNILKQYRDVISAAPEDVGQCPVIKQDIKLIDPTAVASTPPYRLPAGLSHIVHNYVDRLLKAGVIRKSTSPFSSPIMLVKKPHAKDSDPPIEQYRVVNDFRK